MKIFDMHVHSFNGETNGEKLINAMNEAGVYGGCVFSNRPIEENKKTGTSFESRLKEVLDFTKGYEDRLFPVLWIHPYEDDIIKKIRIAVDAGIAAFKIICSDFYVYEDKCLKVLQEIAKLNKPVIFHTGILWDGRVTSRYSQPINFEALLPIEGLRFSMGHCSWPWIDECVALYGKFLNALNTKNTAEMFFDITPGTPAIYRKELLTKLYSIGYDVGDNVMFGTDSIATNYTAKWTKQWLDVDREILDELGVSEENRKKLYYDNLSRFLGKTQSSHKQNAPEINDSKPWSAVNSNVKTVIEKWYKKLEFPQEYDEDFYAALNSIPVSDAISVDTYNVKCADGKRNLLSFLYACESAADKLKSIGVPENIIIDTFNDIVVWTKTWSAIKGELYLGELSWLKRHLSGKLFRIGRLQFCMATAETDIDEYKIKRGDNVVEIHIPEGDKLTVAECEKSINLAKEFFNKYFSDFKFKYFTCHSWLLDDTLKKYLPETSNILKFKNMFDVVKTNRCDDVLRYVFRFDTNVYNLPYAAANSSFAEKIKRARLSGEVFYDGLGVIKKN